jgi:hypothetical protein
MSDKCAACNRQDLSTPNERATQLCASCANALGVIAMPPPRRQFAPCRCCNGMSFIRAMPREVAPMLEGGPQVTSPMAVTFGAQESGWLGMHITADTRRMFGLLEMYVCRACGYVEWYCSDPQNVPVGPQFMTDLVEQSDDGPYR